MSVRFDEEPARRLQELSKARGRSKVDLIRQALDAFLKADEQNTYLDELEARLAATINRLQRDMAGMRNDQQFMFSYLDQMARFILLVSPEILPDQKKAKGIVASERYKKLIEHTVGGMSGKRSRVAGHFDQKNPDE
ncbi:MAG: ribbon-helix-helix protein, CopG family [Burkholderia gladioli]